MGLSRVLQRLYVKVYVGIIVSSDKIDVLIVSCKGEVCEKNRVEFEASSTTADIHDFIAKAIAESPFYYIAVLNNSINQGALPLCDTKKAMDFEDISLSKTLCIDNNYMLYSSKYELDAIEKKFKSFGVDYIFSPFSLLMRIFKEKINAPSQLYLLIQNDYLTLAVIKNKKLLFGAYDLVTVKSSSSEFDDKAQSEEEVVFDLEEDDGISIDDLDALDDLSDLDDLQDLDAISDLDDFSDETVDISQAQESEEESEEESEFEDFGEDYSRFKMITSRLQEYYEDSRYQNEFVETIYIADCSDSCVDLKRYLEEELFLSVIIRKVTLNEELVSLTQEEVSDAS
jgi:hypothetical protein